MGWSACDASVSIMITVPCPVRARPSASAVVHLHAHAIQIRAKQHARVPAAPPRAGKFVRTAGNDFREMEDSTRCGPARSPEETREPSSNCDEHWGRTYSGTEPYRACSESCGTHASEPLPKLTRGVGRFWRIRGGPLRKGFCDRVPALGASARNWLFCKIQSKAMVCLKSQRGVRGVTDF